MRVLPPGDAGAMVNQAILTKDNPIADVLFGIDNTFLSRALDEGISVLYESSRLVGVPTTLQLDPSHRVTPIDFGDVCLNYDKEAFGTTVPLPGSLRDLTAPTYRGMLVVEDPATSSPGLAFLLATIAAFRKPVPIRGRTTGPTSATTTSLSTLVGRRRTTDRSREAPGPGTARLSCPMPPRRPPR